jgi:cell division protein FtsB
VTTGRWLTLAVLIAAAVFAWTGGDYAMGDYRELVAEEAATRTRIDSLRLEADSLAAFRDSLLRVPAFQERMARERLGMIQPGELMIRLVEDTSAGPTSR